jgi:hypothetical protein
MFAAGDQALTPAGYTVRATRAEELDSRVEVHRGLEAGDPAVERRSSLIHTRSSFAQEYGSAKVALRTGFDFVVVEPSRAVACGFDPAIGVAEIEPWASYPSIDS